MKVCSEADCLAVVVARGWCSKHYGRWKRTDGAALSPPCSIDGCSRPTKARGWCLPHYKRWKRHGDPEGGGAPRSRGRGCDYPDCGRPHMALGYCKLHYDRIRLGGSPEITVGVGRYQRTEKHRPWNKGRGGVRTRCAACGEELIGKPSRPRVYCSKACHSVGSKGERHHNWKGGWDSESQRLRKTPRYARWRTAVFERDNYTCQFCGERGGRLEADHIMQWALYPELRFDVDNGRTLCRACHRTTPTWGRLCEPA